MRTYAFIDASNLFYGGEKSLGWKVDYEKLLAYLKQKYGVTNGTREGCRSGLVMLVYTL